MGKRILLCIAACWPFWLVSAAVAGQTDPACEKLSRLSEAARKPLVFHQGTADELVASTAEPRYMNGSVFAATDLEGHPRKLLVLSDYMIGHLGHKFRLPKGWKFVRFIHRGEFELKDGVVVRANETSGEAHAAGVSATNKSVNLRGELGNTSLYSEGTKLEEFKPGAEHFYPGFDEPAGTPNGLHKKRDASINAVSTIVSMMRSQMAALVERDSRELPYILDHWDILTAGLTPGEKLVAARFKEGVERLRRGETLELAEQQLIALSAKGLETKLRKSYIIELP